MKILVLNCGSSSIKYKLFDMDRKEVIAQGGIEKIGIQGSFLKLTGKNGKKWLLRKRFQNIPLESGLSLKYLPTASTAY